VEKGHKPKAQRPKKERKEKEEKTIFLSEKMFNSFIETKS
jgi:hypothetical protein